MSNPQAGWYPDPSGDLTKLRYWDGFQWTDNYTEATIQTTPMYTPPYGQTSIVSTANQTDTTLRLIAFIFNVLTTIGAGIFIIPLIWMIPICVINWNIYKGRRPNTVAFGVVDLIFCNMISGILLLISTKEG